MTAVLHYVYDPMCGWCYGAEPLAWAASQVDGLPMQMHAGGLFPEPTKLPDATRRYIKEADARLAQMSGQPYGVPHHRFASNPAEFRAWLASQVQARAARAP